MANAYVKAALLTAALTLFGFFFISQLDAMRTAELRGSVDDLLFQSESERLLFFYSETMGNGSSELCSYLASATESKASRTYALYEKIAQYEKTNVLNTEYERIRNQYYLSNAALYLNLRAMEKYCGQSPYATVLFFYKVNGDCPECRAQGGVLDAIVQKRPDVRVFAFPSDTDLGFINVFVLRHKISEVPAMVIDDKVVLSGLQTEEEIGAKLPSPGEG